MKRLLLIVAVIAICGAVVLRLRAKANGFSARAEPMPIERTLAYAARTAAMPGSWKDRANPIADSPAVQHEAMAHYADHCAVCHGNDGSGATMLGAGMYPKPPDMRLPETQSRTDGELFAIIENGIRLSGMPAFGGEGSEEASWKLVRFLRHLPQLTPEERAAMEHLNPKGPDEIEEEKQEEKFLQGNDAAPAPKAHPRPYEKERTQ
jgi:mono/diheme cytochrome c family protein